MNNSVNAVLTNLVKSGDADICKVCESYDRLLREHMKEHDFDGLYSEDYACGCAVSEGLADCGYSLEEICECQMGVKAEAPGDSEFDFLIVPK